MRRAPTFLRLALSACCLPAVLGAGDAQAGPAGVVMSQRGSVASAVLVAEQRGLNAAGTVVAWDEVSAAGMPVAVSTSLDRGIVTVAGEVLRGVPGTIDRDVLTLVSDLFGPLRLPADRVAAVVLSPVDLADLGRACAGEPGAQLANGDRVTGRLAFLNPEAVGIDTGKRTAQVPRGRVVAAVLAAVKPPEARQTRTWLMLGSGDRFLADAIKAGQGGIGVEGPYGSAILPTRAIAAAWSSGGRVVPLAQVKPVRLAAGDRLGTALPLGYGEGFPLTAGGVAAADGLVLPARGEAAWPVGGAVQFQCWVAAAPGATGAGVRILLDGKPAFERALVPGAAPVAVTLKLGAARELVLCSDPAADGETAARAAAFCHPLLLK